MTRVVPRWREWLPSEPKTQAVVAMFVVGAVIVAASIVAPFRSSAPAPKAPPPLTKLRTLQWGPADSPSQVASSSNGAMWIADGHRALIYRLSENGTRRQYPLPGVKDPQDHTLVVVTDLASDRSGDAWLLVNIPGTMTESLLLGVSPRGTTLGRYRVPYSESLMIDGQGTAWMTDALSIQKDGAKLTSVSLRSGATRRYTAFSGVKLLELKIGVGPDGGAQAIGQVSNGKQGLHNVVLARLTRDGVTNRPVRWPRSLYYPLGAPFTFDRDGGLWVGYLGGLARIDGTGSVTTYPLVPNVMVLFIHCGPDGRIAFNYLSGPLVQPAAADTQVRTTVLIGVFDPERPTRPPTLQPEPPMRGGVGWFGLGRRDDAVITDSEAHRVFMMPLAAPRPATPAAPTFVAAVRRIIAQHHAVLAGIRHNLDEHRMGDVRPYVKATATTVAETRSRLLAVSSRSATSLDPRIARLIAQTASDGKYVVDRLTSMAQRPSAPKYGRDDSGDYAAAYHYLAGRFSIDLYETAQALGLPPTTYAGHTRWETHRF